MLTFILALGASASAQTETPAPPVRAQDPYAAYAFYIGEWTTSLPGGGPAVAVQRFRWGPSRAYITYSTSNLEGGRERLHFEGIFVYNAANRNMDFLFALEPGSLGQEHGTLEVQSDGSIVRNVTLISPNGEIGRFRQTFWRRGPNDASTSLLRQDASGAWAPTFPGSDNLTMQRRT